MVVFPRSYLILMSFDNLTQVKIIIYICLFTIVILDALIEASDVQKRCNQYVFTTKSVIKNHVISLECQQCNGRNRMSITHGNGRVHVVRGGKVKHGIIFQMISTLRDLIDVCCFKLCKYAVFAF